MVHSTARLFPPGLEQCPDGPRGGQFTPSPSAGWPGPIGRMRPPFTTGDNHPMAFPGCAAVGGPPWPGPVHSAQHAEEDWQNEIGNAVYIQVIDSYRHGRYVQNGATIRQYNEFHCLPVICLSAIFQRDTHALKVQSGQANS